MGEPSLEALPGGAEGFPIRLGELEAFLFVALEEVVQLACDTLVGDDSIGLVVPPQAS